MSKLYCNYKNGIVFIIFLLLIFLVSFLLYAEQCLAQEQGKGWVSLQVEDELSADFYQVYKSLSSPEDFTLIGKLMTVFLKEKGKGYLITPLGKGVFKIRSRKTVRPGSKMFIQSMDRQGFNFKGDFILKKIFTFNTDAIIDVKYLIKGDRFKYLARISYNAPALVEGIDKTFRFFTGKNFVAYKMLNFVDRFHFVLKRLSEINLSEWEQIANDKENLSNLIFPVSFSEKEKDKIEKIIMGDGF